MSEGQANALSASQKGKKGAPAAVELAAPAITFEQAKAMGLCHRFLMGQCSLGAGCKYKHEQPRPKTPREGEKKSGAKSPRAGSPAGKGQLPCKFFKEGAGTCKVWGQVHVWTCT